MQFMKHHNVSPGWHRWLASCWQSASSPGRLWSGAAARLFSAGLPGGGGSEDADAPPPAGTPTSHTNNYICAVIRHIRCCTKTQLMNWFAESVPSCCPLDTQQVVGGSVWKSPWCLTWLGSCLEAATHESDAQSPATWCMCGHKAVLDTMRLYRGWHLLLNLSFPRKIEYNWTSHYKVCCSISKSESKITVFLIA